MKPLAIENLESPSTVKSRLDEQAITHLLLQLPAWNLQSVDRVNQLERCYSFGNFMDAFNFASRVAELAETENHHPSLRIEWGQATVTWWSHSHQGVTRNDCIMAAKTDQLYTQT